MLNFKIFQIPVRVEPIFWLGAFIIGGGLSMRAGDGREALLAILFAMLAIFVSILVHELGHALTSRKMTGVTPNIALVMLGGYAAPNTSLTRKQSFWVTWAGPLAGFGLFFVTVLGLVLVFGPLNAFQFITGEIMPWVTVDLFTYFEVASHFNLYTYSFIGMMLFANFWWSVLNLLPVFPLDGGQIYASVEESPVKVFRVGMIAGGLAAAGFLAMGLFIGAFLFGYLAYQNYQRMQEFRSGPGFH